MSLFKSVRAGVSDLARRLSFAGSGRYWEEVYAQGGNSGEGSYGVLADYKASVINRLVADEAVQSVIEFGCGDGNQLSLGNYPSYVGVDVSATAVSRCRERFAADKTKRFLSVSEYGGERADLALSLDVIYHLTEDGVFENYMSTLVKAGTRLICIYSTNHEESYGWGVHVRHREFTRWMGEHAPDWHLRYKWENPNKPTDPQADRHKTSPADFFLFERSV
jgi:cyclopropane fatty-acyl-phospholipid synthase-like methyltransferase